MKTVIAQVRVVQYVQVEFELPDRCDQYAIERQARIEAKALFKDADDIECIEYEELGMYFHKKTIKETHIF